MSSDDLPENESSKSSFPCLHETKTGLEFIVPSDRKYKLLYLSECCRSADAEVQLAVATLDAARKRQAAAIDRLKLYTHCNLIEYGEREYAYSLGYVLPEEFEISETTDVIPLVDVRQEVK